jgi:cell division protein FtsB
MPTKRRSAKRPPKRRLALRWLGVAVLSLVAFLYYRPARSYFETRQTLAQRAAEVRTLSEQKARLQRLAAASTSDAVLAREARRLGLVKPGEQLFIVKGIQKWKRRHGYARSDG